MRFLLSLNLYKINMIKQLLIVITAAILASCSKKEDDFIGVHNFSIMTDYIVKDTTTIVDTWMGRGYKEIIAHKASSLKVDIFKCGEELKGAYTVTRYQEIKNLTVVNRIHEGKSDIHNLHLVNDTLIGEIHHGKKIMDLKLSKIDSNVHLTLKTTKNVIEAEECNKLASIVNNYITYLSLFGNSKDLELITQSNSCAVEKSITKCLETGYKKDKTEYLRKLLSSDPRK